MYPNLYFLFQDLFGFDNCPHFLKLFNTFGFFVALAFIAAHNILVREMKRKEKEGHFPKDKTTMEVGKPLSWFDVASSAFFGFIFGYKFIYIFVNGSELFQGQGLPQQHIFSFEGSWLWGIIMAAAFGGYRYYIGKKEELPKVEKKEVLVSKWEYVGTITFIAAIAGIFGAKLFHLIERPEDLKAFLKNPSLDSFLGGLTVFGGLIVGGIAVYFYTRKKKINFPHFLDSAAPGFILAYGIGRIGCQVSGDGDWGIPNTNPVPEWLSWLPDWMWAYHYPNNVNRIFGPRPEGYTGKLIQENDPWPIFEQFGTYLDPPVYPTPFYETIMAFIIFGILWSLRKKIKVPGVIFGMFLIFNGVERFFIEKIRVNSTYLMFGREITQAEIISVLMAVSGVILIFWLMKRSKSGTQTPQINATGS